MTQRLALSPVGRELLDDPAADPAAVAESLRNIARANRWLGGADAVRLGLQRVLAGQPRGAALSLVDIGTGLGDLPRFATRWAARRGVALRPIGVERSRPAAALARQGGLPMVLACAGALPVRDKSVDVVLVSQVLHHLAPGPAVALLRACDRVARVGVVVADLQRSALAVLGFRAAAFALRFDRHTRADGVTSIRRGYSRRDFTELFAAARVPAEVHRHTTYRLVATWRPA